VKNEKTPVMVERVVADIDEIVRLVRFPGLAAPQRPANER
jgi:type I restriction enzyme R subunit